MQGPEEPLIDAQMRKINHMIDKVTIPPIQICKCYLLRCFECGNEHSFLSILQARVKSSHEVLEIGCGWGALAIQLVRRTGCRYTGITLSQEQLEYAQNIVKEAGLQDKISFQLVDYRNVRGYHKFNRIISWSVSSIHSLSV